jgi:hypothetical protein
VIPIKRTKNVTYLPSSPILLKFSRKFFGKTLPFKVIRKLFEKRVPGYPEINQNTAEMLNLYFHNSIAELEKKINVDLSIWRQHK